MSDYDDDGAHARRDDPETSRWAADSISSDKLRRSQDAVYRFIRKYGPCTDRFLEETYPVLQAGNGWLPQQSVSGLRTRRNELVKRGLVEFSGKWEVLETNRQARLWRIVGQ